MAAPTPPPVIRAAQTAAERRAALALLDTEWPDESEWFRQELTDPRFDPKQFLVAVSDGAVVGHVQVAPPRPMQYGRAALTVGGLHGLVVARAWRRRGVGRQLVEAAHAQLAGLGATVSVVFATVPRFYARLGYGRAFPLYSTVIPAEAAARAARPLSVRVAQPEDLAAVAEAYVKATPPHAIGPFARTPADWRWLMTSLAQTERSRLRPFFGRERQLLVPADADAAPCYVWIGADDNRLWVFEASCPAAVADRWLATLGARALIRGQREVAITAPPGLPLPQAAYEHGGAAIRRLGPGMACVLDFRKLFAEASPELAERLGTAWTDSTWPSAVEAKLLPQGLVSGAAIALPAELGQLAAAPGGPAPAVPAFAGPAPPLFAAAPGLWVRLFFGQVTGAEPDCPPLPPLLRLLFPQATPHIWPVDNRF